jgi:hypothetical protein
MCGDLKAKMNKIILCTTLALVMNICAALTHDAHASNPSQALSRELSGGASVAMAGSAFVVGGSIATVGSVGNFVVASVKPVAEGSVVVLRAVGEGVGQVVVGGAEISVHVAKGAIVASGVVVGTALTIVKEAAGWALMANGKMVGFVVSEEGAAMLKQKRVS